MRPRAFLPAALAAAALGVAACGSSGGSADAATIAAGGIAAAKDYTCAPAAQVIRASGVKLPAAHRVPFKDRTVSCDYISTGVHRHTLYVVVTFGSTESDLETAVKMLPSDGKTRKLLISGATAYLVTEDGTEQLFAQSGTRLVSVTGDSALSHEGAVAVAKLFLGT